MPTNKDFKRLVRARMQKTGEAYSTARQHLLQRQPRRTPATSTAALAPTDFATRAGTKDALLKAKTGCTWERWVRALDRAGAHAWSHRDIARYVHDKYKLPDWWSQTVTVGYERIKGLRAIGQRRDGSFEATKSKTFPVPLARLYRAWSDPRARAQWLPGVVITVRSATREKYLRITWHDRTSVAVGFTRKGSGKSQVQVQHARLADRAAVTAVKAFWGERLGVLGQVLGPLTR